MTGSKDPGLAYIKDSSEWVVTLIRGLYKPHIGPLPLYEPYMNLIWGYPPSNNPPETVLAYRGARRIEGVLILGAIILFPKMKKQTILGVSQN